MLVALVMSAILQYGLEAPKLGPPSSPGLSRYRKGSSQYLYGRLCCYEDLTRVFRLSRPDFSSTTGKRRKRRVLGESIAKVRPTENHD